MTIDIVRELREDYPAVDVTSVVFSRDFASVGCCVIPQDRVLAIADKIEALAKALEACAAPWASPPGLMNDCFNAMGDEFQCRLNLAAEALATVSSAHRGEVAK